MNKERQRQAFENYIRPLPGYDYFPRGIGGAYECEETERMWRVWQASQEKSAETIAHLETDVVHLKAIIGGTWPDADRMIACVRKKEGKAMPAQWRQIDYSSPETWPEAGRKCCVVLGGNTDDRLFEFDQEYQDWVSPELEDGLDFYVKPSHWCYAPQFNGGE